MFKKPLSNLKTAAPLRGSDRRKFRQRVIETFNIAQEDGERLVPEGLQSVKFLTHLDEPGVAYLSHAGVDPLWFTIGKGSNVDTLIPTVYTLWKHPDLLPFLSTPHAVLPVLIGGADLMIPGVVQCSPGLQKGQLVAVTQYERDSTKLGVPLAVGQMAVDGAALQKEGDIKGKAVIILHTWKDNLWELGSKGEVPEPRAIQLDPAVLDASAEGVLSPASDADGSTAAPAPEAGNASAGANEVTYTPEEVTSILRGALVQAITTNLAALPTSSFPMPSSVFYSSHILPSRPAFPPPPQSSGSEAATEKKPSASPIDIKHSSHKSLTTFLKAMEKDGLITLKTLAKSKSGDNLTIWAVNSKHPDVDSHRKYASIADVEEKREKAEARQEAEKNKVKEMIVREKWAPHGAGNVTFFEACGKSSRDLLTYAEIKACVVDYVTQHQLANARERQYVNVDELLQAAMSKPGKGGSAVIEFIKREDLSTKIVERMQPWHEVTIDGKEPVLKKGALKPISVVTKTRQGRKASTLITGFEPFLLNAEELADELRHACASATSVSPMPGKGAGMEVLVQGKQTKAVTDLLISKGVPKHRIQQ